MKKGILFVAVLSGMFLMSCTGKKTKPETVVIDEIDVIEVPVDVVAPALKDSVVMTTVTGDDGKTMVLKFNNVKGTATIELNGKTIHMIQDTVASGVRMHNDQYQYEEWQGNIVLKKDGKIVFEKKK